MASLLLVTLASACGSPADHEAAENSGTMFRAAVSHADGRGACDALSARTRDELEESAGKPCPEAVLEAPQWRQGGALRVRVFGHTAQIRYADDTVFLSRFDGGWLVTAAGCNRTASGIYECAIGGG